MSTKKVAQKPAEEKPKSASKSTRTRPNLKAFPTQAPPGALPVPPLSPKAAQLYHEFLEMAVAASFGGLKALRCLQELARGRSTNLSSGWAIRWGTLAKVLKMLEDSRRSLYPYYQQQPTQAA